MRVSHLLFVPTNRLCEGAVHAYAREAQALEETGRSFAFALIESNEASHVTRHTELVRALRDRLDIPVIHFDLARQEAVLATAVEEAMVDDATASWARATLLPSRPSYGAGPTKAALLACLLGANNLHRRDSDTVPQNINGSPLYPAELEVRVLGRRVHEADSVVVGTEPAEREKTVLCTATDYQGAPALDRGAFARLSVDLLIRHEELDHPDANPSDIRARVDRKYVHRDQTGYSSDYLVIDDTGRGEMGACAIANLFAILPEMPLTETLGTDYFVRNLSFRMGLPVVYHSRRILHLESHDRDPRNNVDGFFQYSIREARFKVLRRIWQAMNRHLDTVFDLRHADLQSFDSDLYARCADQAVQEISDTELLALIATLQGIFRDAAEAAVHLGDDDSPFWSVASYLQREAPR